MIRRTWILVGQLALASPTGAQYTSESTPATLPRTASSAALERLSSKDKAAVLNSAPYAKLSEAIYGDAPSVNTGKSGSWKRTEDSRAPITYDLPLTEGALGKPSDRLSQGQLSPNRLQLPDADPMKPGVQLRDPIGFHASTYENHAEKKIAIVFEGTSDKIRESLGDWSANIGNAIKLTGQPPKQYQEALSYAQREVARAKKECPTCEIVVTGHSLGGGLAQYAVTQLTKQGVDLQAYTFNPAALGGAASERDSSGRITNIVVQGDLIAGANKLTGILTKVVGDSINLPLERNGPLDAHGIDKLAKDLDSLAEKERLKAEESRQALSRTIEKVRQVEKLKEEARRENREDRRIEYGADKFRDLDRTSEYQLTKSAIDIHGNRVRIDAYIRRPSPTQTEHWVLNYRESRFDYALLRRTFAQPLSSLSEIPAIDFYSFNGAPVLPSNTMTRAENIASNGREQFYWNYLFGNPFLTNDPRGAWYHPASLNITISVQGPGLDIAKMQLTQTNTANSYRTILKFPNAGGVLTSFLDQTCNRNPNTCAAAIRDNSAEPIVSGTRNAPVFTFKDSTWMSFETWAISSDGSPIPPDPILSSRDYYIEKRFRAKELGARDIDIIYSSKFFDPGSSIP